MFKTIYCPRSGLPLAQITSLVSGHWNTPILHTFTGHILHPIYSVPLPALLSRLSAQIISLEAQNYKPESISEQIELSLSLSAIMYSLDCIVQENKRPIPSLPAFPIAVGAAPRVLHLASWYFHLTTHRLCFPKFHPDIGNTNLNWQNFPIYLDACFTIKEEWESGRKKLDDEEKAKAAAAAGKELKKENIYKVLDYKKIWNWIDIQISQSPKYPLGRRETFKTLFLRGSYEPENWLADDIDDLAEAVFDLCDQGNEITFFIRQRLAGIRDAINQFYGSFTLLGGVPQEGKESVVLSDAETVKEKEFFESFDSQISALSELPPAPERSQFPSLGLFLKAQAQHNILVRRFNLINSKKA